MLSVRQTEAVVAVLLFALLLPVVVLPWVQRQYRRYGRLRGWSAAVATAATLYGCGVVAFTLFPMPAAATLRCPPGPWTATWQWRPFEFVTDAAGGGAVRVLVPVVLNVLLFVPLGLLLRYRFGRTFPAAVVIGLAVSLAIELTQGTAVWGLFPCPYRTANVDDLMTNTAGAALGWLVAGPVARFLPPALPTPVADLDPPGLARRGFAFAADLLNIVLVEVAVVVVLRTAAHVTGFQSGVDGAGAVVDVLVTAALTLGVPLLRPDRATPGQVVFGLVPAGGGRAAVVVRYLIWWLPVTVLGALDLTVVTLLAALLVGLAARARTDRRSPLGLVAGTRTVTRSAHAAAAAELHSAPHP